MSGSNANNNLNNHNNFNNNNNYNNNNNNNNNILGLNSKTESEVSESDSGLGEEKLGALLSETKLERIKH